MKPSVKRQAARIELLVFDVDGVLTGGEIVLGPKGEWKMFHVQDGHGFALAREAGLKTALLTGRRSQAVRRRAEELRVHELYEGATDKAAALRELAHRVGVGLERVCYIGDDLVDLPPMRLVGLAVAVKNAVPEVKQASDWVTRHEGGKGAAREVIEGILKAKGLWRDVLRKLDGAQT